jgi:hypothetical protein
MVRSIGPLLGSRRDRESNQYTVNSFCYLEFRRNFGHLFYGHVWRKLIASLSSFLRISMGLYQCAGAESEDHRNDFIWPKR